MAAHSPFQGSPSLSPPTPPRLSTHPRRLSPPPSPQNSVGPPFISSSATVTTKTHPLSPLSPPPSLLSLPPFPSVMSSLSQHSRISNSCELQTTTVSDLTNGKKAIFVAVPAGFTPTCSQKHLSGFSEKSTELKSKGVATIASISVNDAFVMKAWKDNLKVNEEVLLLSEGNGHAQTALIDQEFNFSSCFSS